MNTQKITIGSIVKYKRPYKDEIGLTFTVIEIFESQNWCNIRANVDMKIQPTVLADLSDLETI